jgi:predicted sugar kinase
LLNFVQVEWNSTLISVVLMIVPPLFRSDVKSFWQLLRELMHFLGSVLQDQKLFLFIPEVADIVCFFLLEVPLASWNHLLWNFPCLAASSY